MKLNNWLNNDMPGVAMSLEEINKRSFLNEKTIGLAGKEAVYTVIHNLRSALFPGVYEKFPIDESRINIHIGNNIRVAALELSNLVQTALMHICRVKRKDPVKCRAKANNVTISLIKKLPEIREMLHADIQAAFDGDPAALTIEEIILSYPSVNAVSIYRIAHELYLEGIPVIPRIMTEYAHQLTGIDIHPGAKIGEYFFIDHGTGVVIGETCTIGRNVKLYQGVTLGAKSFQLDEHGKPVKGIKRHPDIEDNVVIYAGATILGGDTVIGRDSVIGGNVWLTESVPAYSKVYASQPLPTIKPNRKEDSR